MRSAVTVCLVQEARQGPFVFHCGIEEGCQRAHRHGFDAVEIFPASAEAVDRKALRDSLDRYGLRLAAMGTGAGWLTRQWTLTSDESSVVSQAVDFIASIIDLAGEFGAPAIVGSMQGRVPSPDRRDAILARLGSALETLAERSNRFQVPLMFEPLNRYETNIFNTLDATQNWLATLRTNNIRILADLFHMNIEEADLSDAILKAGKWIGHVHFADSNRKAMGLGHTSIAEVIAALRHVGYQGYLSAEVFPQPDAEVAAQKTIQSFRAYVSA